MITVIFLVNQIAFTCAYVHAEGYSLSTNIRVTLCVLYVRG